MAGIVKVPGIPMELGGTTRVVPPLPLGVLEQLQDRILNFTGDITDKNQVALVIDATHAALKRNYPELTREEVGEFVDVANFAEIFQALMDVSGLKRKALEDAGAGKPEAGA